MYVYSCTNITYLSRLQVSHRYIYMNVLSIPTYYLGDNIGSFLSAYTYFAFDNRCISKFK